MGVEILDMSVCSRRHVISQPWHFHLKSLQNDLECAFCGNMHDPCRARALVLARFIFVLDWRVRIICHMQLEQSPSSYFLTVSYVLCQMWLQSLSGEFPPLLYLTEQLLLSRQLTFMWLDDAVGGLYRPCLCEFVSPWLRCVPWHPGVPPMGRVGNQNQGIFFVNVALLGWISW